jgi:hypothetical protein
MRGRSFAAVVACACAVGAVPVTAAGNTGISNRAAPTALVATFSARTAAISEARVAQISPASASGWGVISSPDRGGNGFENLLNAVSCTSSTRCVAVGEVFSGENATTLVESWNGSAWVTIPSPNKSAESFLNGVSCTSSTRCVAVGSYANTTEFQRTLIEGWNGSTWSIVASPNRATDENILTGVSCTSSSSCVAIGYDDSNNTTLVERWNGSAWSIVASPNAATQTDVRLHAVSCASSTNCVAVGYYANASGIHRTLIESWNGSTWSIVASPNTATDENTLTGVSCTSSSSCVAVGYDASNSTTLVEHWNGSAWSIAASPNQGTLSNGLSAVSCTSSSSCVAAGFYYGGSTRRTLVESWNGNTWSITPSPNADTFDNELAAVSCSSSSSCVAVGVYVNPSGTERTLVEAGPA